MKWDTLHRAAAIITMIAVVLLALTGKHAIADTVSNATYVIQTVDVVVNSAYVKTSSGQLLEACILTVQGNTYPMQFGGCTELSEIVLGQLHRDYPSVVFNLIINGSNLSLI